MRTKIGLQGWWSSTYCFSFFLMRLQSDQICPRYYACKFTKYRMNKKSLYSTWSTLVFKYLRLLLRSNYFEMNRFARLVFFGVWSCFGVFARKVQAAAL